MSGHHAVHAGLQKHSVSEHYPLAVVGYHSHPGRVIYTVENLCTGEVACKFGTIRQWDHASIAKSFAVGVAHFPGVEWRHGGRVNYNPAGWLEFSDPDEGLTQLERYHKALEQDIG